MSGKLDQTLDEILSTQRRTAGRRRSTRRESGPAKPAPAGGIQKSTKPVRGAATKAVPKKGTGVVGESKIVVSNLPKDVSEAQIKDYFNQAVGQVKRVELSYGPGGVSRGIATVIFHHADGASKAFTELNGLLIDNRPVKVEVVVAKAELIPKPKPLGQRISQPKPQPKSAASDKTAAKNATNAKGGAKKPARRARNSRPAKKTAEELDSEMADYFDGASANANGAAPAAANGAAAPAPAANGDAPMDDEIM
ncbi:RNA annealing protein [Grosmannia clavigera kw1407]|uniref:RNA annealing protein n=1 Tax=Grosmannia clavigera (strain kw1407 / UAMH 11150) TaxID=655863 RepID=F0XDF0_GROCL|nr:RNA annealing protein [Grosmannia clavigera kw1407]EFX03773.1 RNA annealing protein [Grosmannia clavigera kw1407]